MFVFNFVLMAKINTMILAILSYLFASIIVVYVCKKMRMRYTVFPTLKLTRNGISFFSHSRHRLRIDNSKFIVLKDRVYIKTSSNIIILKNVMQVNLYNNYLYFTSQGECKIFFDCTSIFRQFNISVKSEYLDFDQLKQMALLDIINNQFELKNCKIFIKYLKIIRYTLNIEIGEKEIKVKPNKYKIPFTLIYKSNDKIKKINIEQSF